MLGIQHQRGIHAAFVQCRWLLAMQQMQEMCCNRVVIRHQVDAFLIMAEVVPVQQHGAKAGNQAVGNMLGTGYIMVIGFLFQGAERGTTGTHYVHRVGRGGDLFKHVFELDRQAAQRLELIVIRRQLGTRRQRAVDQQIGDLLERSVLGQFKNVIAAIVQIIAGMTHRADGRNASHDA